MYLENELQSSEHAKNEAVCEIAVAKAEVQLSL